MVDFPFIVSLYVSDLPNVTIRLEGDSRSRVTGVNGTGVQYSTIGSDYSYEYKVWKPRNVLYIVQTAKDS